MAKSISIYFRNLKNVQDNLAEFGMRLDPQTLTDILYEEALKIRAKAAENAQSIFQRKTGNLEQSLVARPTKSTKRGGAWSKAWYKVAPHAHLLEFGHRIVGHKPAKMSTGKIVPARPFFKPAVEFMKAEIRASIRNKVKQLLGRPSRRKSQQ